MNKQKEKEIFDLYHTLGIDNVEHVKYTFSESEISRGNLINSEQRKKEEIIFNNYSSNTH